MTSETATNSRPAARGGLFDATFYHAWALDADGSWEYLPTDAAPEDWRDRTRDGALRCPYPDCGAAFGGVRRGAGRVAFVHPKAAGTHSDKQAKETFWSLAATQTLLRWAATAYPDATVTAGPATDVALTFTDGTRITIECRYAALTADEWSKQHEAYQEQGITDVWLFGHAGAYARKAAAGSDLLRPPQPLADLIDSDITAGWLNPFLGLIGFGERTDDGVTARTVPIDDWRLPVTQPPAADEPAPTAEPTPTEEPVAVEEPAAVEEPVAVEEPAPGQESPAEEEPAVAGSTTAEDTPATAATEVPFPGLSPMPVAVRGALRDRQQQLQGWLRKMIGKFRRPAA